MADHKSTGAQSTGNLDDIRHGLNRHFRLEAVARWLAALPEGEAPNAEERDLVVAALYELARQEEAAERDADNYTRMVARFRHERAKRALAVAAHDHESNFSRAYGLGLAETPEYRTRREVGERYLADAKPPTLRGAYALATLLVELLHEREMRAGGEDPAFDPLPLLRQLRDALAGNDGSIRLDRYTN